MVQNPHLWKIWFLNAHPVFKTAMSGWSKPKAHFLQVCLLSEEIGLPTMMAHIAMKIIVGHEG